MRVAVIGAGPGGIVTAKYALEAGFDVTVFEASDDLGGQWHTTASHSGIWPQMHTNTSGVMTAFSDGPDPVCEPLHPAAEQIHEYLRAYADRFGVSDRIRPNTRVARVTPGWDVDGERFDGVVVASGRFGRPHVPSGLDGFAGELLHSFDYPGAEPFRGRPTLVYGNGISGSEIGEDLAHVTTVVAAFRKPRYVVQKNVDGVPADWQWYTAFGALERAGLGRDELSAALRERVLRIAGDPADYGAPAPDRDLLAAGLALCQDWLAEVRAGRIVCRPSIAAVDGHDVTFTDGSRERVEAIICATGYEPHIPYLDEGLWRATYLRTLHPDVPTLGLVGQFFAQGPYLPLLELQARWIVAIWAGDIAAPDAAALRAGLMPAPPVDAHSVFATAVAEELGVAPDPLAWPELADPLLFGPMLPSRYRFQGPGARADAPARFKRLLAVAPRPQVEPADVEALRRFGLADAADLIRTGSRSL